MVSPEKQFKFLFFSINPLTS